jgi:hypothetical protein
MKMCGPALCVIFCLFIEITIVTKIAYLNLSNVIDRQKINIEASQRYKRYEAITLYALFVTFFRKKFITL